MIVCLNALNKYSNTPSRYKNRSFDVTVERGFVDTDSVVVHLPKGYSLANLPDPIHIQSDFGTYEVSVERVDGHSLKYTRMYSMFGGQYPKEKYKDFRSFMKKVVRYDNQKIVLIKNQ